MKFSLDGFDLKILRRLQEGNQKPARLLEREIALSGSAITRRIQRLRRDGLIQSDVAILDPALNIAQCKVIVRVQLKEHADFSKIAFLRQSFSESDLVQVCLETTGPFDLTLILQVVDVEELTAFLDNLTGISASILRYETEFVKKIWKSTTRIRLPDDG